jgi:hypothetical protein
MSKVLREKPDDEHLTDEQDNTPPEKQEAALLALLSHKTLKEAALAELSITCGLDTP